MSETEVTTEVQFDNTDDLDTFASDFFGEKKEAEAPAKEPVAQEPKSEDEGNTDAQNSELTDEDEKVAEEQLQKEPKKSKVQERIDELVKQREDAKRDADKQIQALRKELEDALKTFKPAESIVKTAEPSADAVNADGTSKYPLGEFDPAFIRDLTRFTLEAERTQAAVKANEQRQIDEQKQQKQVLFNSWNEKVAPAQEKYPDFNEKGKQLLDGFDNLDPGYAEYLSTVLMSMDHGPDVLYYLSSNPDEAVKIVNSGAQKATLALGRIEAKYIEAETAKAAAKPKLTKAPEPPVATARGTGGGAKTIEPDTDDLDAFTAEFFRKSGRR